MPVAGVRHHPAAPCAVGAVVARALIATQESAVISVNGSIRPGQMILVAEDHLDSRDALQTLLEAVGYAVVVATDGRQAVARALENHPALILMDMMMPEMDGLDATRTLRKSPEMQDVPILALTALEGVRERVLAAGCDDYITKPIDLPSFLKKLEQWLEAGRQ
jgi:two-component system, cell cycle response regulator DivK